MLTLGLIQKTHIHFGTLGHFHLKGGTDNNINDEKAEKKLLENTNPFGAIHGVVRSRVYALGWYEISSLVMLLISFTLSV